MASVRQVTFSELRDLCPARWEDLSLDAFQKLYTHWELDKEPHERDYFKLLCILSGQPFKEANPTPEKEIAVYELTRWVNEQPFPYKKDLPDSVKIGEKTIPIPQSVEELSIGQMITGRQLLQKANYMEECLSMAASIMLQPAYDGARFDYDRAKELEKELRKMKAIELYPVGFFLLNRMSRPGPMRPSYLRRILNSLRAKLVRMWRPLPKLGDLAHSRTYS